MYAYLAQHSFMHCSVFTVFWNQDFFLLKNSFQQDWVQTNDVMQCWKYKCTCKSKFSASPCLLWYKGDYWKSKTVLPKSLRLLDCYFQHCMMYSRKLNYLNIYNFKNAISNQCSLHIQIKHFSCIHLNLYISNESTIEFLAHNS